MNETTQNPSRQRTLLIVLAAVVALALVFLFVVNPLLAGDSGEAATAEMVTAAVAGATPAPAAQPSGAPDAGTRGTGGDTGAAVAPGEGQRGGGSQGGDEGQRDGQRPKAQAAADDAPLPETFEVFSARDPFQQLVVEGGATATTESTTAGSGSSTTSTGDSGGSQDSGGTTVDGIVFVLVDVFVDDNGEDAVLATVNGTGYEVNEGEVFAENFEVLDIDGSCATFRYGDEHFTLCEGEEIRK